MEENLNPNTSQAVPETQPLLEEETLPVKLPRSKKWYIIGAALVIFLAVASFLGARLLNPQAALAGTGDGGMFLSSKGGPGGAKSVRINMNPAKEIPQTDSETKGLFVRRQDQSIYLGTGRLQLMAAKKAMSGGAPAQSASYDGPVVEVVITHETKVYQDITDMNPGNLDAKNGGEIKIQQVVKPGSLDDLGTNSLVSVWGDRQGDRYIAKFVVFR